jgi:hypothetical protein
MRRKYAFAYFNINTHRCPLLRARNNQAGIDLLDCASRNAQMIGCKHVRAQHRRGPTTWLGDWSLLLGGFLLAVLLTLLA